MSRAFRCSGRRWGRTSCNFPATTSRRWPVSRPARSAASRWSPTPRRVPARNLWEAAAAGDFAKALAIQDKLTPLHAATFLEAGVTGAKTGLNLLGRASEEVRLPLVPSTDKTREAIRAALVHAGVLRLTSGAAEKLGAPAPPRPDGANTRRIVTEKPTSNFKIVADNRKARYHYEIGEAFEAGLVLTGTEVKSLRTGRSTIAESYASVDSKGELWLVNANIPEYLAGNRFNHEPKRLRKLLLKQREIAKLAQGVQREGMTIVPLKLYFNAQGRAKIEIALAKGKQMHDKRETEKKRDWDREKSRLLKQRD